MSPSATRRTDVHTHADFIFMLVTHPTRPLSFFFFFNDTPTTEISPLPLPAPLPIPDVDDRLPHDLRDVDIRLGRDLARHDHEPGRDQCLARDTPVRVVLQDGVEHRIRDLVGEDRKSTRLNSSHGYISYAVFCLKKKK